MEKNQEYKGLRKTISNILKENFESLVSEDELEEERIANHDAHLEIDQKKNFVGSHTYGEDLGKQVGQEGKIYVVLSYGHPLYLWINNSKGGQWYENMNEYMVDGKPYNFSEKHRIELRPTKGTIKGKLGGEIDAIIAKYEKHLGIKDTVHTDVPIGEK